jgi:ubiquinone biosynthesis protein
MLTVMPAARENRPGKRPEDTQPLALEDLVPVPPPPPMPPSGTDAAPGNHREAGDGSVLSSVAATRSGPTAVTSRRLAGSYLWLSLQRRFRGPDRLEALTQEAHRRNARRVEQAVVELQGLFIKVGQLISIMANFLPEAFRRELEGLQDQVPPRPYQDIEQRLREEFGGRGPDEVFAEFDRVPIASASIGQVHVARLHDGERVAVKVQYPDIDQIVRTDLRAMRTIFGLLGRFMPEWGFQTTYREIREMVLAELDYRMEAEAMRRIAANFAERPEVRLPRVISEHSTGRVLTTEWMPGTKAADLAGLAAAGVDRRRAARLVVDAYCQQIFIDGIYHADPHPGNLLLRADGEDVSLVFLDFGATAEVSRTPRASSPP